MKRVHVIGSFHADMAWKKGAGEMEELWESFILRLADLLEQYPDFTYVLEQAAHFRMMAVERPDLVERIAMYARQGRVEVVGGMATTMDTNMPCGESIVRNMQLGNEWFRRNMGAEIRTGWFIDTFGISAQIPQLLNQSGVRRLMANRFGNEMDKDVFAAVGLDGSRVTIAGRDVFSSAALPIGRVLFEFTQTWKQTDSLFRLAAEATGDGPYLLMPYVENEYLPSKRIDMDLRELQARGDGEYFYSLPGRFFDELERWETLPEVFCDLNPEFTGTYSQRIPIRLMNRKTETLLLDAEKWSALLGEGKDSLKKLDEAWWKLAFNHFHDVFTGSHPTEVFQYVMDNFKSAGFTASQVLKSSFGADMVTAACIGSVTAVNGLPRDRREIVEIPMNGSGKGFRVFAGEGEAPSEAHGGSLRFLADLPAMGAAEYRIENADTPSDTAWEPAERADIQNEFIHLEASAEKGVESIVLKPAGRTLVRNAGAMLSAQLDDGNFQIEQPSGGELGVIAPGAKLFRAESKLGQRVLLKGTMKKLRWAADEDIFDWSAEFFLPVGMQRVDVSFHISWRANGVRLRLRLPTEINSSAGIFEIPFGVVSRKPYMPGASKKGEWPAQRFVAMEDGSFGVALVNTGVPGVEAAGGTIRSTLLRSPVSEYAGMYPDDTSSLHGEHDFRFAVVPYSGAWQDAPVLSSAESLNNPVRVFSGDGAMFPLEKSLVRLEGGTAVLSSVKQPRDCAPGEIAVRVYETGGRRCNAKLLIDVARAVWNSNIMEERGEPLNCEGGAIAVELEPFEIRTLRIKLTER